MCCENHVATCLVLVFLASISQERQHVLQSVGVDLIFSDVGTESCLHQTCVKHEVSRHRCFLKIQMLGAVIPCRDPRSSALKYSPGDSEHTDVQSSKWGQSNTTQR